jgi:hypothetical protein
MLWAAQSCHSRFPQRLSTWLCQVEFLISELPAVENVSAVLTEVKGNRELGTRHTMIWDGVQSWKLFWLYGFQVTGTRILSLVMRDHVSYSNYKSSVRTASCHRFMYVTSTSLVLRNVVYLSEIQNEFPLVKRFQYNAHAEIVQILLISV